MQRSQWDAIYKQLKSMFKLIEESEEDNLLERVETYQSDESSYYPSRYIIDSMRSFFITLEDELNKAFIYTDFNDLEYSQLLQSLIDLIEFSHALFHALDRREGFESAAADIGFKLIENTYYMNSQTFSKIKEQSKSNGHRIPQFVELQNQDRFNAIVQLILQHATDENVKTKTILYAVYNHCIHNREQGKQLLLTTDVIDKANNADYITQVLFNRAIVQIGLLAFRNGNMYETQGALNQLCSYGRTKELLGQGVNKQENVKGKLLPYHIHINIDLVESAELIASMILEIPYTLEDGGRITSKTLKKVYEHYERSHFIAEPLNSRDLIYSASKELQRANWKECNERLLQLNMWKKVNDAEQCKASLLLRIKQQSLKCFLIANEQAFTTISLTNLSQRFELPSETVQMLISKMIYESELVGSLTEQGFLRLYHNQQNRTQKILNSAYEAALKIVVENQRNFDKRLGNYVPPVEEDEPPKLKGKKKNLLQDKYKSNYMKKHPSKK